jgi:Asp-tRNA(Asn)/Glu-tRNA(Gln) amidotransferase A subunit family amidase
MSEPLTITDAAKLIKTGELTPSELLEQCLRRVDIYEPAVKAWVYLDRERARQEAAKFTDEIKKGHYRGPLHGIPIGIKDIIDVFDMPTGCGSKLWANSYARRDATCVARLRDAGAVIMGKTVTTPYAYLDPPVTRNPWNLERTPGGSSSGSAAAVACAMCLGALGTQTGGSLTRPASYCGICSFKPWKGHISEKGVLPLATSLDHIGIMSRCVTDLEFIYLALTDARDEHLAECDNLDSAPEVCVELVFDKPRPNYSSFSITRDFFFDDLNEHEFGLFREALVRTIKSANEDTSIYETILPTGFSRISTYHRTVLTTEAASIHQDRLNRYPEDYPPKIRELIEEGLKVPALDYKHARDKRWKIRSEFSGSSLALVIPATPGAPPDSSSTGNAKYNSPWSFLGVPVVSMPVAEDRDRMPFCVQIVNFRSDVDLLKQAKLFERLNGFIPRPLPPIPQ